MRLQTDLILNKWLLLLVTLAIVKVLFIVKEDPICLLDIFKDMGGIVDSDKLRVSSINMSKVILPKIEGLNLPLNRLVAQSYDGASSMSSQHISVSACILVKALFAFYFHCTVHGLNLATSEINKVATIRSTLVTMEKIIVFLKDGAKRETLKKIQDANEYQKKS